MGALIERRLPARAGGRVAQLVEQLTLNQRVTGSIPVAPTKIKTTNIHNERRFTKAALGLSVMPESPERNTL